jgi:hypothetical protein
LDILSTILENYEGQPSFEQHASFLATISHFDTDMVSRFSYAEIAAASVLVAAGHLADPAAAARLLPASLLTDRTEQAAATLRQVAARQGLQLPDAKPHAPLPSPTAGHSSSNSDPAPIPPYAFPAAAAAVAASCRT